LSSDVLVDLLKSFQSASRSSVEALARAVKSRKGDEGNKVTLHIFDGKTRKEEVYDGSCFFLRTSIEYSSPQVTLEELEGLIAARLLEVCVNHCLKSQVLEPKDIDEMAETLRKPPAGKIVPFIFETDDVEPDRYSYNPLRSSIIESGQSAYPVASVNTDELKIDEQFVKKYEGSLVSKDEVDLIRQSLRNTGRYVDFVDSVKRNELTEILKDFGLELRLPQLRLPLEVLMNEEKSAPLHTLIQACHKNYDTLEELYLLMGRSMKKKTFLPTVPHSPKGFGSKRAARGKLVFTDGVLENIRVKYETTSLYPNMADYKDVSYAKCEDSLEFSAKNFTDYSYRETPSSPQFALYALQSPEDSSVWHGVGEYAGNEILRSYASVQNAFLRNLIFEDVKKLWLREQPPIMFNLDPGKMWKHPKYGNIDAGIGCIQDLAYILRQEVKVSPITIKLREPPVDNTDGEGLV
jgi:hypothetical protein